MGEDASGTLRRIEVRSTSHTDTLDNLFTVSQPVVVGDTVIVGFSHDTLGNTAGIFRFLQRDGSLRIFPLPDYLSEYVSGMQMAPDGEHLAYVRYTSSGAEGVVRHWSSGRVIATTPALVVPAGDVSRGETSWTSPVDFEIFIDPFEGHGTQWIRFRGKLGGGTVVPDTVHLPAR